MSPFWLSHHRDDELHRTFAIAGLHVCARCLGVYPLMVLGMVALFAARAPLTWRYDVPFALALTAPALLDWSIGRFRPGWFSNSWRTFTGALLGVALARTLYVHLQRPLPPALIAQAALVTAVGLPVILFSGRFKRP